MRLLRHMILVFVFLLGFTNISYAQFQEKAFSQTYNENADTTGMTDTVAKLFSFKEYFGGLAHKNTIKPGMMFAGSVVLPGTAQIYNKQYWKLPIVYGGIGAFAGTGGYYLSKYSKTKKVYDEYMVKKTAWEEINGMEYPVQAPPLDLKSKRTGTFLMIGAGLAYWGSLLDGVANYRTETDPDPGKATLYSVLLPGLGQIYNGEFYKIPIYWGGLMISVHCLCQFNTNYTRFKRIHNEATSKDPAISGNVPISGETAKWYRDVYRRYRDYSIVATAAVYLLQVIDANVFAYMNDFEVTDDISMSVEPAVIAPQSAYALHTPASGFGPGQNAFGMRVGLRF